MANVFFSKDKGTGRKLILGHQTETLPSVLVLLVCPHSMLQSTQLRDSGHLSLTVLESRKPAMMLVLEDLVSGEKVVPDSSRSDLLFSHGG